MPTFRYASPRRTTGADAAISIEFHDRVFRAGAGRMVCERIASLPSGTNLRDELENLSDAIVGEYYRRTRIRPNTTLIDVTADDDLALKYFRLARTVTGESMYQEVP